MNDTRHAWAERFRELAHTVRDFRVDRNETTAIYIDFIAEVEAAAYVRGLKEGEGTKNGVERYQLGYRDGEADAEQRVWQAARELVQTVRAERAKKIEFHGCSRCWSDDHGSPCTCDQERGALASELDDTTREILTRLDSRKPDGGLEVTRTT